MKKMKRGVIGPLAGSCAASAPLSWTTPVVTVVMVTPDGVPVPRRDRPMAASTGGAPPAPQGATLGVMGGAFSFSLLQVTWGGAQPARWATATFRRTPSAGVRAIDAQRAGVGPDPWGAMGPPAGTLPLGAQNGVRIVLDPSMPPPAAPSPLLVGAQPGHGGSAAPADGMLGVAHIPTSFSKFTEKTDVRRARSPQGEPPRYHPSR